MSEKKLLDIFQEEYEKAHFLSREKGFWEIRSTGVSVLLIIHFLAQDISFEEILESYDLQLEDLSWLQTYYTNNKSKIDTELKEWLNEKDRNIPCYV